jgi:hypothetical protein
MLLYDSPEIVLLARKLAQFEEEGLTDPPS